MGAARLVAGWRMARVVVCAGWFWLVGHTSWAQDSGAGASSVGHLSAFALPQAASVGGEGAAVHPDDATPGFHWKGALGQSALLLGIQHALRMVQSKTREHLGGPFWSDYLESIRGLHGWDDGNPFITNYGGHPMMGSVVSFIQIQNDPRGMRLEWSPDDPAYWKSRLKGLAWAAAYSTTYELAPWGEAGIGNVGYDRGTMGYVDLVVTPLAGFGLTVLEDYLDKRVITAIEKGKSAGTARVLRVLLNPDRGIANLLRFKRPSHRDTREAPPSGEPVRPGQVDAGPPSN